MMFLILELLPSSTSDLKSVLVDSDQVSLEVLSGVVVSREDVERVTVDLDVAADAEISEGQELVVVVNVLVLSSVEELALDDSAVLSGHLVDTNGVISQVEGDDESTVDILGDASVELGCHAQDLLVVVHGLEEINLRSLGYKLVHLTEGVALLAESVIGRDLGSHGLGWLLELNVSKRPGVTVSLLVELLGEGIDTGDDVNLAVGRDVGIRGDLVTGEVVVTDEGLAWLVDIETVGQLLSAEEDGEGVSTVVGEVTVTDLEGIISQVVVDDVGEVVTAGEETKNLAIVIEELLLGGNFAATEGLLHEMSHLGVLDQGLGLLADLEVVNWGWSSSGKGSSLFL
jgi:hypothetical protein